MIPLNTPTGTEIVCVDALTGNYDPPGWATRNDLHGLTEGAVYTVRGWSVTDYGKTVVVLAEIIRPASGGVGGGYDPRRFRLLEIHPSLTALLDAKPVDVKRLLETEGL